MAVENSLFASPRGMRDFYPEDMERRSRIFGAWRAAALQSGFCEYDACVVESLDLLKRKSGEEITDQIYFFKDKSGRDLALRPEMTPTLARMIAAREGSLTFPVKWFTVAQCFRYERTTRGRKREHYQWNLDAVGAESVAAEAEIIATAADALARLGLTAAHYRVRYSNRALLGDLLRALGIDPAHHAAAFLALDKRGKQPDEEIEALLAAEGVDHASSRKVFDLMAVTSLDAAAALVPPDAPSVRAVREFQAFAAAYGIAGLIELDLAVVRGLTYYTGIVFEAFDVERKFRAIFGGGRYDTLLSDLGGSPRTAVGLGFGDVVVAEVMAEAGVDRPAPLSAEVRVGFMQPEQQEAAIRAAAALRRQGRSVDLALRAEKAKHFFSQADKAGNRFGVYIGPDDVASGVARIKNLATRDQQNLPLEG